MELKISRFISSDSIIELTEKPGLLFPPYKNQTFLSSLPLVNNDEYYPRTSIDKKKKRS